VVDGFGIALARGFVGRLPLAAFGFCDIGMK
jgi:hypothetical protein